MGSGSNLLVSDKGIEGCCNLELGSDLSGVLTISGTKMSLVAVPHR